MLTFGREPVYVRAAELAPQLADNPHLRIEIVDSAPPDMEVIELLKPERVQDPAPSAGELLRLSLDELRVSRAPPENGSASGLSSAPGASKMSNGGSGLG